MTTSFSSFFSCLFLAEMGFHISHLRLSTKTCLILVKKNSIYQPKWCKQLDYTFKKQFYIIQFFTVPPYLLRKQKSLFFLLICLAHCVCF